MSINLDNINAAFAKVENVAAEISAVSHSELVPVENIVPSPYNPYNEFDTINDNEAIKQLADSIAVQGLIEPIVLNKVQQDRYVILSGERRYKAIKQLDWRTVPAQVYDNLNKDTADLILHTANLEVREYTSGQKFVFYKDVKQILDKMKSNGKFSGSMQKAIANMLHINERQVRKYERICGELTDDEQAEIVTNNVSINEAYKEAQTRKTERKQDTSNVVEAATKTDIDNIISDYSNASYSDERETNVEDSVSSDEAVRPTENKQTEYHYSRSEINRIIDTGNCNEIIEGYCRKVFAELNLSDKIADYDFDTLFANTTAREMRGFINEF